MSSNGTKMPAIEPVLTMCASPSCSRMRGTKACAPCTTPITFTRNSQSQSASVLSSIEASMSTPALQKSRLTSPNSS